MAMLNNHSYSCFFPQGFIFPHGKKHIWHIFDLSVTSTAAFPLSSPRSWHRAAACRVKSAAMAPQVSSPLTRWGPSSAKLD